MVEFLIFRFRIKKIKIYAKEVYTKLRKEHETFNHPRTNESCYFVPIPQTKINIYFSINWNWMIATFQYYIFSNILFFWNSFLQIVLLKLIRSEKLKFSIILNFLSFKNYLILFSRDVIGILTKTCGLQYSEREHNSSSYVNVWLLKIKTCCMISLRSFHLLMFTKSFF